MTDDDPQSSTPSPFVRVVFGNLNTSDPHCQTLSNSLEKEFKRANISFSKGSAAALSADLPLWVELVVSALAVDAGNVMVVVVFLLAVGWLWQTTQRDARFAIG